MKIKLLLLVLLCGFLYQINPLQAQDTKGVTQVSNASVAPSGVVRAVVVGISDYQDPNIPDLRFADKDAISFSNYLKSPSGGSLSDDNMKVFINDKATTANFVAGLDWLIEQSKEGDLAVIYFSGHGDIETKTRSQWGFLLTWDSPSRSYVAGAFPVNYLQDVVSTLSLDNKSKVLLVTDACHAGKLAGNAISGSQATAANLAKQFASETKILSCQPNEYSIEGEQWGGGHGAFTYHLVDALYGLADGNQDQKVSLLEVGRYLEDHVTGDVAPQSQLPLTLGNRTEVVATVKPDELTLYKKKKEGNQATLTSVASRGMEDEIVAKADTSVRMEYASFQKAISDKKFLSPAGSCAYDLYLILSKEEALSPLHSLMKRNLAAAMQNEVQQVLNNLLKMNISEITLSNVKKWDKYKDYPILLERAAELLGKEHKMYNVLMARKNLFEGYLMYLSNPNSQNRAFGEQIRDKYFQSLALQPDASHTYLFLSYLYANILKQPDSVEYYARKAMETAPEWLLPYSSTAFLLTFKFKQSDRAKPLIDKALSLDPNSVLALNTLGYWNQSHHNDKEAEKLFEKTITLDSNFIYGYNNLAYLYINSQRYKAAEPLLKKAIALDSTFAHAYNNLGLLLLNTERLKDAEPVLRKAIQLDSTNALPYNNLGLMYMKKGKNKDAENMLKKAISLDSTFAKALTNLGSLYISTRQLKNAEPLLLKSVALDSTDADAFNDLGSYYLETRKYDLSEKFLHKSILLSAANPEVFFQMARLYSAKMQSDQALQYLDNALEKGFRDYDRILMEPDFDVLRKSEEFKQILRKFFPDKDPASPDIK